MRLPYVASVVSVLVAALRLEHELHPTDATAAARDLEAIVSRALDEMEKATGRR